MTYNEILRKLKHIHIPLPMAARTKHRSMVARVKAWSFHADGMTQLFRGMGYVRCGGYGYGST